MQYKYDTIPLKMKNLKRWVLWKTAKTSDGKLTKIPINAKNGYGAKSNDEDTWVSFDEALSRVDFFNCKGLGFMLGKGIFGVDLDHTQKDDELVKEFTETLKSYTELSQSGEGVHIICEGVLPVGARRKGNIEMYDNARFFALTGNRLNEYELRDGTEEIKSLHSKYLGDRPKVAYVFHKEQKRAKSLSDDEVIRKAMESKNGNLFTCLYYGQWEGIYKSQSEADASFCSLLAFWTGKDGEQMDRIVRSSKLYRDKWDMKKGQYTYGEITISNAIAICKDVYENFEEVENGKYDPITGEVNVKKDYDLNDTGNAQRFIDKFGANIRYNFDNKCWVVWDGKTWLRDTKQLVKKKADLLIEEMKEEAIKEPNEKYAQELMKNIKHLSSNNGKEAMLKEAMHLKDIATVNADYDKDEYLLNCDNGVVDLRTGKLMPHDKKYMMSKNTNVAVDFENEPKMWLKCLDGVFKGSEGLINFVHKAVGYSLTGSTKEQCLFQCKGNGSNGKSVFFTIVMEVMGSYAINTQIESILARGKASSGNASPDIARMNGARLVRTNEPEEGVRFNEGLVKQITGGNDIITARFLYGTDFEFRPKLKLWIACNYEIVVRGTDKGIWRRMRLIPFDAEFEGKNDDKDLEHKLRKELPQILGWAIKGCLKWQKEGLEMPIEVINATKNYRQEMDKIATFLNDCVIKKESEYYREKASDVYMAYKDWALRGNEWLMTQTRFGKEMAKKFPKKQIGGYTYYLGIILKKNSKSYTFNKGEVL